MNGVTGDLYGTSGIARYKLAAQAFRRRSVPCPGGGLASSVFRNRLACRRPVINTSLDSGVPFASRHGETGLTVEPMNASALGAAMRTIFRNSARSRLMGEAGRKRVEHEFSREVMGERIRALYEEIA